MKTLNQLMGIDLFLQTMKTLNLSALGGKKLIVCTTLAVWVSLCGLSDIAWGLQQSDIPIQKIAAQCGGNEYYEYGFTLGVKAGGTVIGVGADIPDVSDWTNIIQVDTGYWHTVGLKSDGTVVAIGSNSYGQCNVGGWTDIVQIAASSYNTIGLKSNGRVVAVGYNYYGETNVGGWTDIVQVESSGTSFGLKSDGTVVAVGFNGNGKANVGSWTNIVQIATYGATTFGLKSNGTVVSTGSSSQGALNVGGWLATPGTPTAGPIVLTTSDGPLGAGYYETPIEVLGGPTYTITASNPQ